MEDVVFGESTQKDPGVPCEINANGPSEWAAEFAPSSRPYPRYENCNWCPVKVRGLNILGSDLLRQLLPDNVPPFCVSSINTQKNTATDPKPGVDVAGLERRCASLGAAGAAGGSQKNPGDRC